MESATKWSENINQNKEAFVAVVVVLLGMELFGFCCFFVSVLSLPQAMELYNTSMLSNLNFSG